MEIIWKATLVFFVVLMLSLGSINNDKIKFLKHEYKQSFELAVDAGMDSLSYTDQIDFENQSYEDVNYDTDRSLDIFYKVLEGNLSTIHVNNLKSYIPVKIFIMNDHLVVYNNLDQKEIIYFDVNVDGTTYSLSINDENIYPFDKKNVLSYYINSVINQKLDLYKLGNVKYTLNLNSDNAFYNQIDSVGFIVFTEGLPIPSLLPFKHEVYYVNSIAGDQVIKVDDEY